MVEKGCDSLAEKGMEGNVSDKDKSAVKSLMCDSLAFVADGIVKQDVKVFELSNYLIGTGISIAKLSDSQQVYCNALRAEIALNIAALSAAAAATFTAASASAQAGVVAGGITGTVTLGPLATAPGMAIGGGLGAAGPLAIGAIEMYKKVSKITDAAFDLHSQCGPLASYKVTPWRNADTPQTATTWCGDDAPSATISSTA
jgi:hypothetical protein